MSIHYIKDPVHHLIKINDDDKKIMDTPLFQRLRNIFHLGTAYFTYPGATHSRFEHCLGVMSLGSSVLNNVINNSNEKKLDFWKNLKDNEIDELKKTLRYACLLHDIGHTPFSHVCEEFYEKEKDLLVKDLKNQLEFVLGSTDNTEQILRSKPLHELMSCSIILSHYSDMLLKDFKVNPKNLCSIILGRVCKDVPKDKRSHYNVLSNILNSSIDVDKFDYLLRDNYMTGASLASLDKERLLTSYTVSDKNNLVLSEKGLSLVTNLIVGRNQVYMWVYQHHKVVFTDSLMRKIISTLIDEDLIKSEDFFSKNAVTEMLIDDYDIIYEIRKNAKKSRKISVLYSMWRDHKFLKPCWKHAFEFHNKIEGEPKNDLVSDARDNPDKLEKWLAENLKIETCKIMVSHAKFEPFNLAATKDIPIDVSGSTKYAIGDFGLNIKDMAKYSNVPYIYVDKDHIENCLCFLKDYSSSLISD
ncbi:MAG: HD domain-containing protein [Candidatus Methanoperedens sp.]|nr:HD domain-containing protein [Candidatus Methanoperedens sp.]